VQGQLEHPAIVPVYELAESDEGHTYFTMKRVKGESLHEVIGRLRTGDARDGDSRRRRLNAFAQVCLAVDFAHKRGVVHRDLKPANIMLGDFGEVYVLDWGVAKIEDAPELDDLRLSTDHEGETQAGAILGTPGYAAPEQVGGTATRSSDIYSLGAVLFELLTFEKLHVGRTAIALLVSTTDGANAHIAARCPDADVPPELEAICVRATATDPADRYPSARALHDALTAFLDGDRDLALRQAAAVEAAERARALGRQALEGDDAVRPRAMQAVGRALGLDPGNRDAIATLVGLLEQPPRDLPPQAAAEVDEAHQAHQRLAARGGALGFMSWFFYLPLLLVMGVRDVFSLGVSTVLMLAAALSALAVLGPIVLEAMGWIPRQTVFSSDAIHILPGVTAFDPLLTPLVLGVASLALIITPVVLIGRARDAWNAAQRDNAVRAWHLRQLVADEEPR
jgi:serine/threonine-protein kinase